MINLILHYLLALPDKVAPEEAHGRTKVSAARKRKSMDLATMMAAKAETATPLLFNLVDLILACLRSHNQQTVYVTLQLVSAILKRHHRYAVITLLRTEGTFGTASLRTVGAHQQEVDYLMALAGAIGGQDNFDELYHGILKDTTARLEAHPCSLKLIAPKVSIHNHKLPAIPDSLPGAPRDVRTHTLRPEDPLLNMVLDLLDTFFVNPVETNLALTEVILDLASCGYVVLEGWLLRNPAKYTYDGDGDGDDNDLSPVGSGNDEPPLVSQASLLPTVSTLTEELDDEASPHVQRAMQLCRRPPRWNPEALPRLLATLHTLVDQVEHYRASVPRFDDLLQLRREAFQTADAATAAPVPIRPAKGAPMATTPERRSMDEARSTTSGGDGGGSLGLLESSPSRPSGLEGFAQRILSELSGVGSQSSGSRSGSPRRTGTGGKEYSTPSKPLPVPPGALSGGYGLATPTTGGGVGPAVPPKEFPINYENPSRSGSGLARSYSPGTPFRGGEDAGIMSSPYGGGSLSPGFMPGSHRRRSKENEDPAVASQIAAFKAIDASILARVVGLPTPGSQQSSPARNRGESSSGAVEPIKIDFGRRPRGATGSEDGQWAGTSGSAAAQHSGLKQQESSLDIGPGSDVSTTSDGGTTTSNMGPEKRTATVSHVLTNVIILQGFLFELAALVQVRGGMFDEVRFV